MPTSSSAPRSEASGSGSVALAPERSELRLRMNNGYESGVLDGAWWPQSRDLQTEAADLVDHFPNMTGGIERLLFSRPDWDAVAGTPGARRIQAARGPVKVGSFPSDDTHLMVLKMRSGQHLRVLVIPSDTAPDVAGQIMERAADERDTRSPSALLGLLGPDQSGIGFDAWNDQDHPAGF